MSHVVSDAPWPSPRGLLMGLAAAGAGVPCATIGQWETYVVPLSNLSARSTVYTD